MEWTSSEGLSLLQEAVCLRKQGKNFHDIANELSEKYNERITYDAVRNAVRRYLKRLET